MEHSGAMQIFRRGGPVMGQNIDIRALMDSHEGTCGGSFFSGKPVGGFSITDAMQPGTTFPNGAKAAVLFTYDVEGDYGNGSGDVRTEIKNYFTMTKVHENATVSATYNIVGKMAEDHGSDFVKAIAASGAEIASHGYRHDMQGKEPYVYHGHFDYDAVRSDIEKSVEVLTRISGIPVKGCRLPYGHFNNFCYDAFESAWLSWASNATIQSNRLGSSPGYAELSGKRYNIVEIPMDGTSYDWPLLIADENNQGFLDAVHRFAAENTIVGFDRTPHGAFLVWKRLIDMAIEHNIVFTLLCHPINLAVQNAAWDIDALNGFLLPIIRYAGELQQDKRIWTPTCSQLVDFYISRKR